MEKNSEFGYHQHPNINNTLPHYNPFPPLFNSTTIQNFTSFDFGRKTVPTMVSTPPEKKFIVFDQSHAKTTMFYFSEAQFGASRVPKNPATNKLSGEKGHIRVSNSITSNLPLRKSVDDYEATEDEMHEDTEELNALLSSSDEYEDGDDEEKSTGHSPSTVTNNGSRGPLQETEEVDSFAVRFSTKRRRIPDEPTALGDDDAESVYRGFDKRVKRDKIHETLRVLRGLIPGTEGKDGVAFIDEAVEYLRSLKVKAKALGLDAL